MRISHAHGYPCPDHPLQGGGTWVNSRFAHDSAGNEHASCQLVGQLAGYKGEIKTQEAGQASELVLDLEAPLLRQARKLYQFCEWILWTE